MINSADGKFYVYLVNALEPDPKKEAIHCNHWTVDAFTSMNKAIAAIEKYETVNPKIIYTVHKQVVK